jgi:guanylate kinase
VRQGTLFIISAPSGAGKTTILKQLLATVESLTFSVSHTTRQQRPTEQEGVDYFFLDRVAFETLRNQGAFLEHAEVHGNYYGTSVKMVLEQLGKGIDVILDIDVQGAAQVRENSEVVAVSVFIVPPSWEELQQRLRQRGTDSPEVIEMRCANARRELTDLDKYDYVVVNDRIDEAVATLRAIIVAERSRKRRLANGAPLELEWCQTAGLHGCP